MCSGSAITAGAPRIAEGDGWRTGADSIREKAGARLSLSISSAAGNRSGESAEALIAQQLKAIGVELSVKNYAGALLFDEHGPLYGGTYDMAWIVNTEGPDPDNIGSWGCGYIPPRGANTDFYCNKRVDALLRDAERQADQAARKRDYATAWAIMLDEVPAEPVGQAQRPLEVHRFAG